MVRYRLKHNVPKNRYNDILCYDTSRVVLTTRTDEQRRYINANYVDGYKHNKAYICCQGPLDKTVNDFWLMVWENNVRLILMTTK